jgi:ComF family protein
MPSALASAALRPVAGAASGLLDLVLPPRCPGCRAIVSHQGRFCAACWGKLAFITAPMCPRCGAPFAHDRGPGTLCAPCLAAPPRFDSARAAFAYDGPARDVLLGFKHAGREHLAAIMAPHMLRAGGAMPLAGALVVPVPLHWTRLVRRGFNQAALLARQVARRSGGELAVDALLRVRRTPVSKGMGRQARTANVRGAFRVRDKALVRGRRVILIDDVLTTGATAEACARLLRRAGAAEVHVLTWARVVRDVG